MKRIYNKIPLSSVLYLISGAQEIVVYDVDNTAWKEYADKRIVYSGLVSNFYSYTTYTIGRSEVHGIDVEDGKLVFTICTKYDEY